MTTYVQQSDSIYNTLASFFTLESTAAADNTGTTLPVEFRDYINAGSLDYSELLRVCLMAKGDNPSVANGAAIEAVSHSVAVNREYSLCVRDKTSYMADRIAQYTKDAAFLTNTGIFTHNKIR